MPDIKALVQPKKRLILWDDPTMPEGNWVIDSYNGLKYDKQVASCPRSTLHANFGWASNEGKIEPSGWVLIECEFDINKIFEYASNELKIGNLYYGCKQ